MGSRERYSSGNMKSALDVKIFLQSHMCVLAMIILF